MPVYRCIGLDREGRKCAGTFQASSLEAARSMVIEQGYSIVELDPVEGETAETEKRRLEGAARTKPLKRGRKNAAEEPVRLLAAFRPGAGSSFPFVIGGGVLILILLPALVYFFFPRQAPLDPQAVVREYLASGAQERWQDHYLLLSEGMTGRFPSQVVYVRRIQKLLPVWEKLRSTGLAPVTVKAMLEEGSNAMVSAAVPDGERSRKLEFLLVKEWGAWKVDYVRDTTALADMVEELAGGASIQKQKLIRTRLMTEHGYSAAEVDQMAAAFRQVQPQPVPVGQAEVQPPADPSDNRGLGERTAENLDLMPEGAWVLDAEVTPVVAET